MKKILKNEGQSLVEVMIALAVLTAGFLGIMSLLAQSFHISRATSDETTATYLAAEGIELTKNLIDHDVYEKLAGNPGFGWGACFGLGAGASHDYQLDYTQTSCPPPDYIPGAHLRYDPTFHLYSYVNTPGSVFTDFTRKIRITVNPDPAIQEIDVQSIVIWPSGSVTQNIDLEDAFYNWHP